MKQFAVWAGMMLSFIGVGAAAQVASGNVAESSHPRADALAAQNSPVHRTVEGCLVQQGSEYVMNAKHLGMIHLTVGSPEALSQKVGQRVKIFGNLAAVPTVDVDEDKTVAVNSVREMQVERIQNVAGTCR